MKPLFLLLAFLLAGCTLVTSFDDDRTAEITQDVCTDGLDNDDDGRFDCEEPGCDEMPNCRCNPVASTVPGCPPMLACDFREAATEDKHVSECRPAGMAMQGETCLTSAQCAAGFVCVRTAANQRECARYCDLATAQPCNEFAGTICRSIGAGIVVHGASFGICLR